MTTESNPESSSSETSSQRPRRLWLLLAWFAFLGAMTTWFNWGDADPGVGNTATNAAVVLSVLGFAIWTVRRSGFRSGLKWSLAGVPVCLLAAYYTHLLPIETINDGDVGIIGWRWRWMQPDKQLAVPKSEIPSSLDWQTTANDYPRFLGNGYWAEAPGVTLEVDWESNPPRELWRKKIGAGWSAFAIVGKYAVTQEQRGERELVTCYEVETGEIAWTHADPVRWDPSGGGALGYAGPRATPASPPRGGCAARRR